MQSRGQKNRAHSTRAKTLKNKQRGGSVVETLPSSRNTPIGYNASKYDSISSTKVGGRKHNKKHNKKHSKKHHNSHKKHKRTTVDVVAEVIPHL